MTTLPNMGLVLPTRGAPGSGAWGDAIDANYVLEDAHDHTTGKGARVPTAGLNINADLPFSSIYAPTQLHRVQFSSVAAAGMSGSNNKSLFVSDGTSGLAANELYWRNNSGNNVRVTSGNSLNISLAGAIGGDYSSVGAQLNYDDAGKRYTFKEGTSDSNGWARLASGDARLFPFGTTGANFVGLAAPGGIGASYTATWPAALPSASSFVKIDNTGAMSFTLNSQVYQHTVDLVVTTTSAIKAGGNSTSGPDITLAGSTSEQTAPLVLPIGTLTAWTIRMNKGSASGTISAKLFRCTDLATPVQIGSTQSNSANNPGLISLGQSGLSEVMVAGRQYYIVFNGGGVIGGLGDHALGYSATVST